MRLVLLLTLATLAGCPSADRGRRRLHKEGYTPLRHLYSAPQPTVGPALCQPGETGDVYLARRKPTPEQHCPHGVFAHVLVCCPAFDDCHSRELHAECASY